MISKSKRTIPNEALSVLEQQYFGECKHESAEIERLPEIISGVRCFVDIGASLGQYSYFAAQTLKGAKFYCVEADPYKARRLRELTAEWKTETGNEFEVIEKAASDRPETVMFFVPKDHLSSGALFPLSGSAEGWEKIEVEAVRLDDLFNGKEVDFLKLDVEGAEYRVLAGATNLLQRCDMKVLLEIAPWGDRDRFYRPSDVLKLLSGYGYDLRVFADHYLFAKGGSVSGRWLKSRLLGFVLDHPSLKRRVKNIFNWLRSRQNQVARALK